MFKVLVEKMKNRAADVEFLAKGGVQNMPGRMDAPSVDDAGADED